MKRITTVAEIQTGHWYLATDRIKGYTGVSHVLSCEGTIWYIETWGQDYHSLGTNPVSVPLLEDWIRRVYVQEIPYGKAQMLVSIWNQPT